MSLRRSQRAGGSRSAPTKHEFGVGDVVELIISTGLCTAQLLHSVRKGRWLVAFDKEEFPDKEVSEKSFGRIVACATDQSSAHSVPATSGGGSKVRATRRTGSSTERAGSSSEDKAKVLVALARGEGSRSGQEVASRNRQESSTSSSDNAANNSSKLAEVSRSSSSMARVRKRVSTKPQSSTSAPKKYRSTSNGDKGAVIATRSRVKRGDASGPMQHQFDEFKSPPKVRGRGQQKLRNPKCEDGTVVVKVEMLTGTLHLYRGAKPRAEFIRRV